MRLILIILVIVMIPAALLFFRQHSLIYYPRRYPDGFERALPAGVEPLRYTTAVGEQVAFYVRPRSGPAIPARVWVMFSGNASVALDWLFVIQRNPNEADAYLLIDYPGYGKSEGVAGIASTRGSADKAVSVLAEKLGLPENELAPRLCVVGVSLGAAAALEFAVGHPVQRAVLIAPFTTLREEAATLFSKPASYLLRENYDNRSRLRELAGRATPPRVAIFHGTEDTLIRVSMGQELAESVPAIAQFFPIARATHDTIVSDALTEIIAWMNH
jgi:hypothetical protein